jgi:stage II sporulation protein AA (anti-sigma F factor antagonist)
MKERRRGGVTVIFKYTPSDKLLIVCITEEIDHHSCEKIRRRIDYEIQRHMPKKVIFDFSSVTFMDSAGIGLLVGRYKMLTMIGGVLEMMNIAPSVKKVLEMSGVLKIIPIYNQEQAS